MKVQTQAYFDNDTKELAGVVCYFNDGSITEKEADSIVGLFPKYVKVNKVKYNDGYGASFQVGFRDTKVAGNFNETAIKRTKKLFEIIEKNNIEIDYKKTFLNSYETLSDFLVAFNTYDKNATNFGLHNFGTRGVEMGASNNHLYFIGTDSTEGL